MKVHMLTGESMICTMLGDWDDLIVFHVWKIHEPIFHEPMKFIYMQIGSIVEKVALFEIAAIGHFTFGYQTNKTSHGVMFRIIKK